MTFALSLECFAQIVALSPRPHVMRQVLSAVSPSVRASIEDTRLPETAAAVVQTRWWSSRFDNSSAVIEVELDNVAANKGMFCTEDWENDSIRALHFVLRHNLPHEVNLVATALSTTHQPSAAVAASSLKRNVDVTAANEVLRSILSCLPANRSLETLTISVQPPVPHLVGLRLPMAAIEKVVSLKRLSISGIAVEASALPPSLSIQSILPQSNTIHASEDAAIIDKVGVWQDAPLSSCGLPAEPTAPIQFMRFSRCVLDDLRLLTPTVKNVASPTLTRLVLSHCDLINGASGVDQFADSLTDLEISHCNVSCLDSLEAMHSLVRLNLSGNGNLEDVQPLRNLHRLEELNLSGCRVRSVAPLSECVALWSVKLSRNPVREGLVALKHVEELFVDECGLSDELSWSAISELSYLRRLVLAGNSCAASGGRLPVGFRALTVLRELDIQNCHIRDFEGLAACCLLTKLVANRNPLHPTAVRDTLPELPRLTHLSVESCGVTTLRNLDARCPNLEELRASGNKNLTSGEVPKLSLFPRMTLVDLSGCGLTSANLLQGCALNPATQITSLSLAHNYLSEGAAELSGMRSIQVLNIANCGLRDVSFLENLPKLRQVELRGNVVNCSIPLHVMMTTTVEFGASLTQESAKSPLLAGRSRVAWE